MSVRLSAAKIKRLTHASETIATAASEQDVEAFRLTVAAETRDLVEAEQAMCYVPIGQSFPFSSHELSIQLRRDIASKIFGVEGIDAVPAALRLGNDTCAYFQFAGDRELIRAYERSEPFLKYFGPNGIHDSAGLFVPNAGWTAVSAAVYNYRPVGERGRFNTESLALLQLLRPTFRAGVELVKLRASLPGAGLDTARSLAGALPQAVWLVGPEGGFLHRSAAALRLVTEEPAVALLEERVREAALAAVPVPRCVSRSRPDAAERVGGVSVSLETTAAHYRINAVWAPGGSVVPIQCAVVVVERTRSRMRPNPRLSDQFGLTPREASVAQLLALGMSNREVATTLGVTEFTARRHTEAVIRKLGVSRRSGVAARVNDVDRD